MSQPARHGATPSTSSGGSNSTKNIPASPAAAPGGGGSTKPNRFAAYSTKSPMMMAAYGGGMRSPASPGGPQGHQGSPAGGGYGAYGYGSGAGFSPYQGAHAPSPAMASSFYDSYYGGGGSPGTGGSGRDSQNRYDSPGAGDRSPYNNHSDRGGGRGRGGAGRHGNQNRGGRGGHPRDGPPSLNGYYQPSMMEDPWAKLENWRSKGQGVQ